MIHFISFLSFPSLFFPHFFLPTLVYFSLSIFLFFLFSSCFFLLFCFISYRMNKMNQNHASWLFTWSSISCSIVVEHTIACFPFFDLHFRAFDPSSRIFSSSRIFQVLGFFKCQDSTLKYQNYFDFSQGKSSFKIYETFSPLLFELLFIIRSLSQFFPFGQQLNIGINQKQNQWRN